MTFLHAILMGLIQGLTEFLPVSSSGHLVLTSSLYKFFTNKEFLEHSTQEIVFDIILHVGTLVAVMIYFRKEILEIISALIKAIKTRDFSTTEAKLGLYIIIGTFFTVLVAYPLKDVTENLVMNPFIVSCILIITGCILFFGEFIGKNIKTKNNEITLKTAILIGLAQGLAAFPGLSRSGTTISIGLMCGLDRVKCARYSFLLSLPIIICASIFYPILEVEMSEMITYSWLPILAGFLVSVISGYFCIKYFLKFLNKYSMNVFAIYCFAIGIFGILFFK